MSASGAVYLSSFVGDILYLPNVNTIFRYHRRYHPMPPCRQILWDRDVIFMFSTDPHEVHLNMVRIIRP